MGKVSRLLSRLWNTLRPARREQGVNEELGFHVDSRADDLAARGLSRTDAIRQARLEFGGLEKYKEQYRETRSFRPVEDFLRDLTHASRSLRRSPALVLTSVLSLALGVGVNTTLFSGITAIFGYQPTAAEPDRLTWVEPGNSDQYSYPNYRDLRDSKIFADAFGYRPARLSLRLASGAESIAGMAVTNNFFQGLGVSTQLGRVFTTADGAPETNPRVAVLSHRFWTDRFANDPGTVGQVVTLNGEPFVVVGILPKAYRPLMSLTDPGVYVPLSRLILPTLDTRNNGNALEILGRLRPGTTREQMQVAVTALGQNLERAFPADNQNMSRPARLYPVGGVRMETAPLVAKLLPPALAALCGLVLLNACANVAGLLLARAAGRQREMALRVALGASRGRLLRALLAESFLLSCLGTVGGLLLTVWLVPILRDMTLPAFGTVHLAMEPDLWLVAYASVLVVITSVMCGLVPALRATRKDVVGHLQLGGGHGTTERLWLRHALVVAQVAISVVLLVVSLLFLRTLLRLTTLNTGIDLDHGIVATIDLPPGRYTSDAVVLATRATLDRLDATPGVQSTSIADILPRAQDASANRFETDGSAGPGARTFINSVGPRYFETLGIPVLRGREFRPADRVGAAPVVIVSRAFATAYFPDADAIGKRIRAGNSGLSPREDTYTEIVGVVQDSNYRQMGEPPSPILYYSYAQRPVSTQYRPLRIHVRTSGSPSTVLRTVSGIVSELDRDVPVRVSTLREATSFEFDFRRTATLMLATLGILGLALAMVGLYGTISYIVASRTAEIGVRIALGASSAAVLWGVLRQGLKLTAWGVTIGIAVSLVAGRLLAALLAGLSPADPVAFGGTAIILTMIALCASYMPARRATRVDPVVALRSQ